MDAKHMLYLLELFEGKLSITDILEIELPLLLNLEKEKAEQIEKEAKRISTLRANTKSGNKGKDGTIVNKGKSRK